MLERANRLNRVTAVNYQQVTFVSCVFSKSIRTGFCSCLQPLDS